MKRKLSRELTNDKTIINMGTSLMVVVLLGLSLIVIAALTLSSAKNNLDLSRGIAEHTKDYYDACSKAYEKIDEVGWKDQTIEIEMENNQSLVVTVKDGAVTEFRVTNNNSWNVDDTLPVHIAD